MAWLRKSMFVLLPVLVAGLAMVTNVLPFRQIVAQRQQMADSRQELARLKTENDDLQATVSALDTPLEVERIAREQLGYVRPGETAFVLMEPDQTQTRVAPSPAPDVEDPGTRETGADWLRMLWDYFTGEDLGEEPAGTG